MVHACIMYQVLFYSLDLQFHLSRKGAEQLKKRNFLFREYFMNEKKSNKSQTIRQVVLVGVLFIVLAAFLYDKYVLEPSSLKKIDEIVNKVSLKLSEENRQQIHDILGFKPSNTFEYKGYEVEQYRFPRGLPGFPGRVLDIAYQGDTMAFFRQEEPMDNAFIDSKRAAVTIVDSSLKEDPGKPTRLNFGGGGRPPGNNNKKPDNKDDDDAEDDGDN